MQSEKGGRGGLGAKEVELEKAASTVVCSDRGGISSEVSEGKGKGSSAKWAKGDSPGKGEIRFSVLQPTRGGREKGRTTRREGSMRASTG